MKSSVPKHLETGLLTDQYSTHVAQNIDIYVRAPTCYPITSNLHQLNNLILVSPMYSYLK